MNGKKETLGISVLGCYIHTVNVIKPYTSFQSVKPPLPWEPPIQGYDFPRVLDGDNIDKLETRIKKKAFISNMWSKSSRHQGKPWKKSWIRCFPLLN